jgi:galactonate dehydratase
MKITAIKPFLVDHYLLLRVYTDVGLVGNAEAGLWAHHAATAAAIGELAVYYVGKDPRHIEHHYQVVSRQTHFQGAVLAAAQSAIDVALWDILGKSVDLPVWQLLGGKCRDKVKVFTNVVGASVSERADSARAAVEAGYVSLRMTPFAADFERLTPTKIISEAVEMVAAVRQAIGDGVDLGLEIHRNLRPEEAISLARELEPFQLLYYEDPLPPESIEALQYVARHVNLPMATGERFYSIFQFKDLIDRQIVSLIRPDVSLAGGFTQVKKVAALAEAAFVGVFPHLMGSWVNNTVFTHLAAAIPNYVLMESNETQGFDDIVDRPLKVVDGYRPLPTGPGIGIEINEAALAKFPYRPRPITGFFQADGSVAH